MQHDEEVTIILDHNIESKISIKMILESDMNLTKFRKKSSRMLNKDILNFFTETGEKVTDYNDFRKGKTFIASEHFHLQKKPSEEIQKSDLFENSNVSDKHITSTDSNNSGECKVEIEFISHFGSGKTTLIQSFVNKTLRKETNSVLEAVYHKRVSGNRLSFDLFISDVSEETDINYSARLKNKQIVIIAFSKEKIIEAINSDSLELMHDWIKEQIIEIKKHGDYSCQLYLAVTKYDIVSDCEFAIEQFLKHKLKLDVVKVSSKQETHGSNVLNSCDFFNLIIESLVKAKECRRRSEYQKNGPISTSLGTFVEKDQSWLSALQRLFSCR